MHRCTDSSKPAPRYRKDATRFDHINFYERQKKLENRHLPHNTNMLKTINLWKIEIYNPGRLP
jgi:hypothetical protein